MEPTVNRHTRRREQTRTRIITAAESLMRERGVDAVTIQDITERADVGHGSFYVHFETKNDVLVPIAREHAAQLNRRLDHLVANITDPALAFAFSVRHLFHAITSDVLWSYFVFQSGLPNEKLRDGIGDPGRADLEKGQASGRFDIPSIATTQSFLIGAIVGVVDDVSRSGLEGDAFEVATELVLRTVGIGHTEAREISRLPLPPLSKKLKLPTT